MNDSVLEKGRGTKVPATMTALAVAVGLTLRLATAITSYPHPDEEHYVEDAMWAYGHFDNVSLLEFLREHPRTHYRLSFPDLAISVWPPPFEGRGRFGRIGHPTLQAWIWGAMFAVHQPESLQSAVRTARVVNALADTSAIALIPVLIALLGAATTAGAVGAWLYALHPASVAYAGIANQDPILAPLLLLTAIGSLRAVRVRSWVCVGVATGLLVAAKQTGLVVLLLVPLWVLQRARLPTVVRMLPIWGTAALATASLFVNPLAYFDAVLHPAFRMGAVGATPWSRAWSNLGYLIDIGHYWGIGFDLHGGPPEWLMARPHAVLSPAYLLVSAIAFLIAVLKQRRIEFAVIWLTVIFALASMPPTDGMWRMHMLWPLVCTGIACSVGGVVRVGRIAIAAASAIVMLAAFAPAYPTSDGNIRLADIAFANPGVTLPYNVHRTGLVLQLPPGSQVSRTVLLAPGRYTVLIDATESPLFEFGDESWVAFSTTPTEIELSGWVHSLKLSCQDQGSAVRSIRLVPR